jgi:hypothetical protein
MRGVYASVRRSRPRCAPPNGGKRHSWGVSMGSTAFGITLGASRAPARSWKSPDTRGVRFRSAHPVAYPPPFIAESTSIRRSRHGLSPRIVGAHTGVLLRCEEILLHEACRGFLAQWDVDGATDWLTGTPVTARMPSWASHLISSPLRSVGGFPLLCGNEGGLLLRKEE